MKTLLLLSILIISMMGNAQAQTKIDLFHSIKGIYPSIGAVVQETPTDKHYLTVGTYIPYDPGTIGISLGYGFEYGRAITSVQILAYKQDCKQNGSLLFSFGLAPTVADRLLLRPTIGLELKPDNSTFLLLGTQITF